VDKNKITNKNNTNKNNKLIQLIESQKKNMNTNKPIINSKEFKSFELEKQLRDVSPILTQKNKN
jgi:hypothetical protein